MSALCAIFDVGYHMNGPPIEAGNECLKLLVQHKFFSQSKEQFSLVLAGTETTDNELADDDGNFANISVVRELAAFDWDILEAANAGFAATSVQGDLIDAIFVGIDHLIKRTKSAKGRLEKHILIISNLEGETDISQMNEVIENLKKADVILNVIGLQIPPPSELGANHENKDEPGPSAPTNSDGKSFSEAMKSRVMAFSEILEELNGESFAFDDAAPALALFENRAVSQRAWKVNLEIGESLRIPLAGYTMVREARLPSMHNLLAQDPDGCVVKAVTTYHLNDDTQTPVNVEDTVRGFRYGATMIPFSDEDMDRVKKTAQKGLSVIGFTRAENVPHNLYVGNNVMVFVADAPIASADLEEGEGQRHPTASALSALAQALFELNAVALVRRVYSRASAPVLGVLTPRIEAISTSLVYHELPFQQDIRALTFPSLPIRSINHDSATNSQPASRNQPSAEQLEAMDSFVTSMMLQDEEGSDDEDEKLGEEKTKEGGLQADVAPERVPNPWIQRFFSCVRERGLNRALDAIPMPSTSTEDGWPILNTETLPGLESVLTAIQQKLSEKTSSLRSTLREVNRVLPPTVSINTDIVPNQKRVSEKEEEDRIKKKRRTTAAELFGFKSTENSNTAINDSGIGTQDSWNPFLEGDSATTHIGSVNPIGDFNDLLTFNLQDTACHQLEAHVYRLIEDPLAASLLRPKAVLCLRGYREAGIKRPPVASAYNAFLQAWRNALETPDSCENGESSFGPNRLAFWREVIAVDPTVVPISNEEVAGVDLTPIQANSLVKNPLNRPQPAPTVDKQKQTPIETSLDELIDELE